MLSSRHLWLYHGLLSIILSGYRWKNHPFPFQDLITSWQNQLSTTITCTMYMYCMQTERAITVWCSFSHHQHAVLYIVWLCPISVPTSKWPSPIFNAFYCMYSMGKTERQLEKQQCSCQISGENWWSRLPLLTLELLTECPSSTRQQSHDIVTDDDHT